MFWGKELSDWEDIYSLLKFQGIEIKSFRDLMAWLPPMTPKECMNIAFDLAEARAAKYEIPVRQWALNIMTNREEPII